MEKNISDCIDSDSYDNAIIFTYKFNNLITENIIELCNNKKIKKMVFNNYIDNDNMMLYSNNYFRDVNLQNSNLWRGNRFNKSIDALNNIQITDLILGAKFNKSVSNLPNTLISLILSFEFNNPIDNLPNKLEILSLGDCIKYSHSLDYLPESLIHIVLPPNLSFTLDNLPQSIKILDLHKIDLFYIEQINISILPKELQVIIIIDDITDEEFNYLSTILNNNNKSINLSNKGINIFKIIMG
jgi:hypothetical protein